MHRQGAACPIDSIVAAVDVRRRVGWRAAARGRGGPHGLHSRSVRGQPIILAVSSQIVTGLSSDSGSNQAAGCNSPLPIPKKARRHVIRRGGTGSCATSVRQNAARALRHWRRQWCGPVLSAPKYSSHKTSDDDLGICLWQLGPPQVDVPGQSDLTGHEFPAQRLVGVVLQHAEVQSRTLPEHLPQACVRPWVHGMGALTIINFQGASKICAAPQCHNTACHAKFKSNNKGLTAKGTKSLRSCAPTTYGQRKQSSKPRLLLVVGMVARPALDSPR